MFTTFPGNKWFTEDKVVVVQPTVQLPVGWVSTLCLPERRSERKIKPQNFGYILTDMDAALLHGSNGKGVRSIHNPERSSAYESYMCNLFGTYAREQQIDTNDNYMSQTLQNEVSLDVAYFSTGTNGTTTKARLWMP